jgi:hypothetical protein
VDEGGQLVAGRTHLYRSPHPQHLLQAIGFHEQPVVVIYLLRFRNESIQYVLGK